MDAHCEAAVEAILDTMQVRLCGPDDWAATAFPEMAGFTAPAIRCWGRTEADARAACRRAVEREAAQG